MANKDWIYSLTDYYFVMDFEATCEENKRISDPEITEFAGVLVDARTTTIVNEFQQYVRPKHNPTLSAFCTQLTGITQEQVDAATFFPDVYRMVQEWLTACGIGFEPTQRSMIAVTCGDWDLQTMLPKQLKLAGDLPFSPLFARWCNIKKLVTSIAPANFRVTGMPALLEYFNLPLEGRHHSGLDDSRNIAKVLIQILQRRIPVPITGVSKQVPNLPPLTEANMQEPLISHTMPPPVLVDAGQRARGSVEVSKPPEVVCTIPAPLESPLDESGMLKIDSDRDPLVDYFDAPVQNLTSRARVNLSRRMTALLRHNARKVGMTMTANGFVSVDELLARPPFRELDIPTLAHIVRSCEKQRFRLVYGTDSLLYICANQGHTIPSIVPNLKEIRSAGDVPMCVHGTTMAAWNVIRHDGLRPMRRAHIHMAKGLPGDTDVKSGMRKSSEVCIYLDVAAMLRDGIPLHESYNGVLLSPEDPKERRIAPKYFAKVTDRNGNDLLKDAKASPTSTK